MKDILVENFVWIKFSPDDADYARPSKTNLHIISGEQKTRTIVNHLETPELIVNGAEHEISSGWNLQALAGDRPPRIVINLSGAFRPTNALEFGRLPGIYCEMIVDMSHTGNKGVAFDNSIIFHSKEDALEYRKNKLDWFSDDSRYALLSFQTARYVDKPTIYDPTPISNEAKGFGAYSKSSWEDAYVHLDENPNQWVNPDLEKWFKNIVNMDNDSVSIWKEDCTRLTQLLRGSYFNDNKVEIIRQARGGNKGIFRPLFEVVFPKEDLDDINYIDILEFAGVVFKESTPLIFACKKHFLRARPETECLITSHIPTPPHPSFPSGHATQAMLSALVLGDIWPEKKDSLITVAKQIGKNREIAGVHYPTDTLAGQKLAGLIFDELMKNTDFTSNYLEPVKEQYNPQPLESPAQTEGSALELGE